MCDINRGLKTLSRTLQKNGEIKQKIIISLERWLRG